MKNRDGHSLFYFCNFAVGFNIQNESWEEKCLSSYKITGNKLFSNILNTEYVHQDSFLGLEMGLLLRCGVSALAFFSGKRRELR